MNNKTDEQLVSEYLLGDNQTLEILIQRYLNQVYIFVNGYIKNSNDAEDVTQEVFIKVWKKIDKYNPEFKFKTWIFTIAKNTAFDFIKKKKPIPFSVLDDIEEENKFSETIIDPADSPLVLIEKEDEAKALKKAIDDLPKNYRVTLDLHYRQELKFREISGLLGKSIETIKTQNRRAILQLKKMFAKKYT